MDFDDDLVGDAPCEFCGELFPLRFLIEHQSIHLVGDDYYPYLDDILDPFEVQNVIAESTGVESKTDVIIEQNQLSAVRIQPEVIIQENQKSDASKPEVIILEDKQSEDKNQTKTSDEIAKTGQKRNSETLAENLVASQKHSSLFSKTMKDIKKLPEQKGKEFITEKGEKLLVYGDEIDPDKELENEKQTYKMPNNPLLSTVCQNEEDVEHINNLSDDDSGESLEEFWKRARDFLKKNRVRSER